MRHPNKQNNGTPVIGARARKKATRTREFRQQRMLSRLAFKQWKHARKYGYGEP